MANTINAALLPRIIGEARETLKGKMSLARLVNPDFSQASGEPGNVVSVGIPAALTAATVTAANTAPAPSAVTNGAATVTIDNFKKASFAYSGTDFQNYDLDRLFVQQLQEAVRSVARAINDDLLDVTWKQTPYTFGNSGTGAFASNLDGLATIRQRLVDRNVDPDVLAAVLCTKDMAAISSLSEVQNANQFGGAELHAKGAIARAIGFDLYEDQSSGTAFVKGTITGDPVCSTTAAGATSITVTTDSNDAVAVNAGDVLEFDSAQYVALADLDISASGTGTLSIDRGLETALDGDETLAFATTDCTYDANSLRSVSGDFSGLSLVTRLPAQNVLGMDVQGDHYPIVDDASGLSLLLSIYPQYHQVAFEISAIWGCDVTDSRKLQKILTYSS